MENDGDISADDLSGNEEFNKNDLLSVPDNDNSNDSVVEIRVIQTQQMMKIVMKIGLKEIKNYIYNYQRYNIAVIYWSETTL